MTFIKNDLLNQAFGRLKVIASAPNIMNSKKTRSHVAWKCKCICGKELIVKARHLLDGTTKSCGCLNNEQRIIHAKALAEANRKYTPKVASAKEAFLGTYSEEGDTISFEFFLEQSQKNCFYCGKAPSNCFNAFRGSGNKESFENGKFIYNGLDRVDNSLPHTPENCVPCCAWCNTAKNDRTQKDFLEWAEKAYQFFVAQKGGAL